MRQALADPMLEARCVCPELAKAHVAAFTLVELLVVITIIVVLLALLAPAMDRAIYESELTVCGTRLNAVADSVTIYAAENRRRYPHRQVLEHSNNAPNKLATGPFGRKNDVPMLMKFMSVNRMLNDPLLDPVDWEVSAGEAAEGDGIPDDTLLQATYALWFGWQWRLDGSSTFRGMFKLGDRFGWNPGDGSLTHQFSYLATDWDFTGAGSFTTSWNSHPDAEGVLQMEVWQKHDSIGPNLGGPFRETVSRWIWRQSVERGPVDSNFAQEDGSVFRLRGIVWNEWDLSDGRTVRVPFQNTRDDWPNYFLQLPKH